MDLIWVTKEVYLSGEVAKLLSQSYFHGALFGGFLGFMVGAAMAVFMIAIGTTKGVRL